MVNVSIRCLLLLVAIHHVVGAGCTLETCRNGGKCEPIMNNGNDYQCTCTAPWMGMTCDEDPNPPCVTNPCMNGGTCIPDSTQNNNYRCVCNQRLSAGKNCEIAGSDNTTTIVIAVAAVVVLLVLIAVALACYVRRSRDNRNAEAPQLVENGQELQSRKAHPTNTYQYPPGKSREFPRDKLHLFGIIGSGSFAVVYKAEAEDLLHKGKNTTVAVKMLKDTATPTDKSDFKKELDLYMSLEPHRNVVSMLGCCTDRDPCYILLEYVPHGNMQTYLRHIRTGGTEAAYQNKAEFNKDNLTPTEILTFACQVVRGMEYLASKKCIHRDLATRNILLGDGLVCKVTDFGLARDMAEKNQYEMQSRGRVPVRWMAPESLINNIYTCKSDVWSFGVLLWELVTLGSHPYPGMTSQKVIAELQKGYRLPKPLHCGDDIYKIMMDCWKEKPDERPDFSKLHSTLDILLTDATGYLEMTSLNKDDYVYLEPNQQSGSESE